MKIHLIAVGERMPGWVQESYAGYARRLPRECALQLVEITPGPVSYTHLTLPTILDV